MKKVYLGLSIIGTVIPLAIFIPWLQVNGLNIGLFVSEWFANRIAQFFAVDFLISWFVWLLFILYDKKKYGISYWWIPVIGNFCIGLSFSLPFYLYLREGNTNEVSKSSKEVQK